MIENGKIICTQVNVVVTCTNDSRSVVRVRKRIDTQMNIEQAEIRAQRG